VEHHRGRRPLAEARGHDQVDAARHQVAEVVEHQGRLEPKDCLGLVLVIAAPKAELHVLLVGAVRVVFQPVEAVADVPPGPQVHVVSVHAPRVPCGLSLLRCEVASLPVGDREEGGSSLLRRNTGRHVHARTLQYV